MSIATTSLKYGWKVLAILTIGTGTIFVADSTLRRITTRDRIEVTLAIVERCLATQYSTNPVLYRVDPPSIVRTWTDTNGASVIVTNAIEWRDDLSMKIGLDAKLKALCPYFVDTNTVYDGSSNIVMHTFTGLLTSLDLGDHTNFTAIPAIGTNAATFGPWAWRNYVLAWQERYKVLNALEQLKTTPSTTTRGKGYNSPRVQGWEELKASVESNWPSVSITTNDVVDVLTMARENPFFVSNYIAYVRSTVYLFSDTLFNNTALSNTMEVSVWIKGTPITFTGVVGTNAIFDNNGTPLLLDEYIKFSTTNTMGSTVDFAFGDESFPMPNWCLEPPAPGAYTSRGYGVADVLYLITPKFLYATNKWWQ